MEAIIRALAVYVFLFLVFRIAGKRSLAEITTFEFVLLLVIGEATQQAIIGNDFSVTNAYLLILTLVSISIGTSLLEVRSKRFQQWTEGMPTLLIQNGKMQNDVMKRARVDEEDILQAARELRGLERMDQIKHAVLEKSGGISIVPKEGVCMT